jgi:hypothetical protein
VPPPGKTPQSKESVKWHHILSSNFDPEKIDGPRTPRKAARRTGPLDPKQVEKTNIVRRLGSCLPCRLSKIPVGTNWIVKYGYIS